MKLKDAWEKSPVNCAYIKGPDGFFFWNKATQLCKAGPETTLIPIPDKKSEFQDREDWINWGSNQLTEMMQKKGKAKRKSKKAYKPVKTKSKPKLKPKSKSASKTRSFRPVKNKKYK